MPNNILQYYCMVTINNTINNSLRCNKNYWDFRFCNYCSYCKNKRGSTCFRITLFDPFEMKRKYETKKAKQINNQDIVNFYFKQDQKAPHKWHCKCGKSRQQAVNSGTTNLVNHVLTDHPNYREEVNNALNQKEIQTYFLPSEKATNIYGWLDWVISEGYIKVFLNFFCSYCC